MTDAILKYKEGRRSSPGSGQSTEKGTHKETLAKLKGQGFARLRADGTIGVIEEVPALEKNNRHDIDIVIDRIVMKDGQGAGSPKTSNWPSTGGMASSSS